MLALTMHPSQDNTESMAVTSPEPLLFLIILCLSYYRERLCEYCTGVNKKIHMLSLRKNAQMQGQPRRDPGPWATANGLCGPKANIQEWWLLMSPRSCLATVSINFCLSRSFFRNCANMLFLRLVSFILNREGEKGGKVFEIVPDKE